MVFSRRNGYCAAEITFNQVAVDQKLATPALVKRQCSNLLSIGCGEVERVNDFVAALLPGNSQRPCNPRRRQRIGATKKVRDNNRESIKIVSEAALK